MFPQTFINIQFSLACMGLETARSHQLQQLVRIKKDLEEILADASIDRELVRPALEYVHAVENGDDPYPKGPILVRYHLFATRPKYFIGISQSGKGSKIHAITYQLCYAKKIKKRRERFGHTIFWLNHGDYETLASIDQYLDETYTEDGKKIRPVRYGVVAEFIDYGKFDVPVQSKQPIRDFIDYGKFDVPVQSEQPIRRLAGRVKKKVTRSPRKVEPIPDFETIGHFVERERPELFSNLTFQEKVVMFDTMLKNMERDGDIEKRPKREGTEYYILGHEDGERARILRSLDGLGDQSEARQGKPEQDKPAK